MRLKYFGLTQIRTSLADPDYTSNKRQLQQMVMIPTARLFMDITLLIRAERFKILINVGVHDSDHQGVLAVLTSFKQRDIY